MVTLEDKNDLHYLNAVINETHRCANISAFNLFHATTQDVTIHGYHFPPETIVVDHRPSVHKDKRNFEDPEIFRPERFIDENGKFFTRPEVFPFGLGKRECMGQSLAKVELFLFVSNIFNQFKLNQIPSKPVTGKRVVGTTTTPEKYFVNMTSRW